MIDPTHPQLVTAIAEVRAAGYLGDFAVDVTTIPPGLLCFSCHRYVLPRKVAVDAMRSFASPTDDPDQTVLFAITCPRCGASGALLDQRAATTPEEAEVLADLESRIRPPASPAEAAALDVVSGIADPVIAG